VAQWDQKIYQVVYYTFKADVTDSNKLPAVSNYTLGQTVTEQSISNPGYTFDGWFNAADDQPFTFGFTMTDISEPYVLYGKWTPIIYTVTYVLVEEEEAGENEVVENNPANPETFTIEDDPIVLQDPTRDGYTFNGWKSESVTVSTVGGVTTNIVLTAQWLLIRYNITYVLDGGQNNFDNPRNFNVEETYPLLPAVKEGYTFTGWKNQNNQTMTEIPLGISGDLTLTAQWTINKYTFRYRTFEGQSYTTVNNKEYGSTLGMATPTRRGYTFLGWEDNATGASYTASSTMPDNNLDLTGIWEINTYSIDYNLNLGTTAPTPFIYNFTVLDSVAITSPTKTGSVFVGWDKDGNGTADHTPTAGVTTISAGTYAEDLTLRAIWTQTIYTITYNSSGGSSVSPKTFTYSQALDNTYFPVPVKAGETFQGWFDAQGRRWAVGVNFLNVGPNNSFTLTARWATFPRGITFDADNGEDTYSTSVMPGSNVYIGFTPYKEGYTFVGWMDLDDGTFYTKDSIMPDKELTLTAQWEPIE
jgi:uncharacterized repeat protein (TIGR02543 family)